MRFRLTLITFILLVIMGISAYYTHIEFQKKIEAPPPLYPFTKDDLPQIKKVIIWARGDESVCERKGPFGWWYFTNSKQGKVDSRKIKRIVIKTSSFRKVKPLVADAKDLAQFGLEKENTAVEIWFNEKAYKIIFGYEDIKREMRYARLGNSRDVFLVEKSLFKEVNKGQLELADMRLFGLDTSEMEVLGYKEDDQVYELSTTGSLYKFTSPLKRFVGVKKAGNLLSRFNDIMVTKFTRKIVSAAETNIERPELFLSVTTKGYPIEVGFVAKNDKIYYAKRNTDEQILEIPKGVIEGLIEEFKGLLDVDTSEKPGETEQ